MLLICNEHLKKNMHCTLCISKLMSYYLLSIAVEDLERNDGSPEKPYYMSKDLRKILGKKNVMAPSEKKEF